MMERTETMAEVLNGQGFRYYKKCEADASCFQDFTSYYADAVKWDPTYETAIYNAACGMALKEDKTAALAYLRKLRALGTKLAQKKLSKAPGDSDFKSIRDDARFLKLTR